MKVLSSQNNLPLSNKLQPSYCITETAINIGYSSKLLVEEMRVIIINAEDRAGVEKQLTDAK